MRTARRLAVVALLVNVLIASRNGLEERTAVLFLNSLLILILGIMEVKKHGIDAGRTEREI